MKQYNISSGIVSSQRRFGTLSSKVSAQRSGGQLASSPSGGKWENYYQGMFQGKTIFKRLWKSLPKFVLWQLWLARNSFVFQNKRTLFSLVATRVVTQLSEYMNSKHLRQEDLTKLNSKEKAWVSKFNLSQVLHSNVTRRACWQLQLSSSTLDSWLSIQTIHTLCFDDASKGNPREAGAEGVLYGPGGHRVFEYY